jgi:hypothetical protein
VPYVSAAAIGLCCGCHGCPLCLQRVVICCCSLCCAVVFCSRHTSLQVFFHARCNPAAGAQCVHTGCTACVYTHVHAFRHTTWLSVDVQLNKRTKATADVAVQQPSTSSAVVCACVHLWPTVVPSRLRWCCCAGLTKTVSIAPTFTPCQWQTAEDRPKNCHSQSSSKSSAARALPQQVGGVTALDITCQSAANTLHCGSVVPALSAISHTYHAAAATPTITFCCG